MNKTKPSCARVKVQVYIRPIFINTLRWKIMNLIMNEARVEKVKFNMISCPNIVKGVCFKVIMSKNVGFYIPNQTKVMVIMKCKMFSVIVLIRTNGGI